MTGENAGRFKEGMADGASGSRSGCREVGGLDFMGVAVRFSRACGFKGLFFALWKGCHPGETYLPSKQTIIQS